MAVLSEEYEGNRIRHYSDRNMKILQVETGIVYDDAVDVVPCQYTYTETNEPIEDAEVAAQEALDIMLGYSE